MLKYILAIYSMHFNGIVLFIHYIYVENYIEKR